MINLIPIEEKKKIAKGFYFRLLILFLFVLSLSIIVVTITILPSYYLSLSKAQIIKKELIVQGNKPMPVPDEQSVVVIKDLDVKLSLIEKSGTSEFFVSQNVIDAILLKQTSQIQITEISYDNTPLKGRMVGIRGNAPSREVLLLFRQALEDSDTFKQVDLPISNFVKGSNIEFNLSLIPRPNDG